MNKTDVLAFMSGSSLDGLDIACIRLVDEGVLPGQVQYEFLKAATIEIPTLIKQRLKHAPDLKPYELALLDHDFGVFCGKSGRQFMADIDRPTLVSFHGHTLFHQPEQGISNSLGSLTTISALTGLPVAGDFRSIDVANGGQGAPLAPIVDKYFFTTHQASCNLGGIANISYTMNNHTIGCDVSACNQLLNALAQKMNMPYDRDGHISRKGAILPDLLEQALAHPFYKRPAPKSLSNQWVQQEVIPLFTHWPAAIPDLLRTACAYIGTAIAQALPLRSGLVQVSGGGAHHPVLMEHIQTSLAAIGMEASRPADQIIDFKECLLIALLGWLRWHRVPLDLRTITGSNVPVSLGILQGIK